MTAGSKNGGAQPARASDDRPLRSSAWFGDGLAAILHRMALRSEGLSVEATAGRPLIGICNSWSELVNCNMHFRALAQAVKRGVLQAGGMPLEFPTISLGENLMKPTTMLYRNLMAMDVEECIRSYPLDAVVLVAGCDKTTPAQLMGAASANVPAIMTTGGPAQPAIFRGRELGVGTDLWHYADEYRANRMSEAEFAELEASLQPSSGHCNEMGTASTMTSLVEALGMGLSGTAAIPAVDSRRYAAAEAAGRRAVELAIDGPSPREILSLEAFENAATLLMALGGSTNAVIHLTALAGRVGVPFGLEQIDAMARRTPIIVDVRPVGRHLFEGVFRAGGVPAVLKELMPLLNLDALTVSGRTLGEEIADAAAPDGDVIHPMASPVIEGSAMRVLHGTLAPDGALIKAGAGSRHLLSHRGPALVFEDIRHLGERIDDPDLDVDADSVLVLKNAGPRGGPGMPEWGQLPLPAKLLKRDVSDMVRISDARMSGTSFGTIVLHVSPESAAGGPLGLVVTGDMIALDVEAGTLDVELSDSQIEERRRALPPPRRHYARGYGAMFLDHVLQANEGCDFDFLRAPGDASDTLPLGLNQGWAGGW